jgi:multiple sugar transport system permease protein
MVESLRSRRFIRVGTGLVLVWSLAPWGYMVGMSLGTTEGLWEPYRTILTSPSLHLLSFLKNSLLIAGCSAFLAVGIALLAAFAMTRLALPGGMGLLLGILAVSLFPQISIVGMLFEIMSQMGLINRYPALVFPYVAWVLPLTLWILVSYCSTIPRELDEAAVVDGCSPRQLLRRVIAPLAVPGMISAGLLALLFALNEFLFALMLTTDFQAQTIPVGLALFQGVHGQMPWAQLMAAATLTTLPVVLLAVVCQRWIVQGMTAGAVKG